MLHAQGCEVQRPAGQCGWQTSATGEAPLVQSQDGGLLVGQLRTGAGHGCVEAHAAERVLRRRLDGHSDVAVVDGARRGVWPPIAGVVVDHHRVRLHMCTHQYKTFCAPVDAGAATW